MLQKKVGDGVNAANEKELPAWAHPEWLSSMQLTAVTSA